MKLAQGCEADRRCYKILSLSMEQMKNCKIMEQVNWNEVHDSMSARNDSERSARIAAVLNLCDIRKAKEMSMEIAYMVTKT